MFMNVRCGGGGYVCMSILTRWLWSTVLRCGGSLGVVSACGFAFAFLGWLLWAVCGGGVFSKVMYFFLSFFFWYCVVHSSGG